MFAIFRLSPKKCYKQLAKFIEYEISFYMLLIYITYIMYNV